MASKEIEYVPDDPVVISKRLLEKLDKMIVFLMAKVPDDSLKHLEWDSFREITRTFRELYIIKEELK